MLDARGHGTIPLGMQRHNARLRPDDVRAIRESDDSIAVLARRFGCGQATIADVVHGRTWTWLV